MLLHVKGKHVWLLLHSKQIPVSLGRSIHLWYGGESKQELYSYHSSTLRTHFRAKNCQLAQEKKKEVSWHIMCRKVIGNMTFGIQNAYELAPFLDVSYCISKQLGNLSQIMPVPIHFLLEMSCLQLHFLFMILQETSLLSLCNWQVNSRSCCLLWFLTMK